jgi:uncharacterized RDD family membrane protein YckC
LPTPVASRDAAGVDPADAGVNPPASMSRRLAASVYEALLLAAVAMVVEFALLPLLTPPSAVPADARVLPLLRPGAQAISLGSLFVMLGLYCAWGWSDGRRTLPMKTWRIAMESGTGGRVGIKRAALRYAAGWIGPALAIVAYALLRPSGYGRWAIALLAFNYAWALFNADRQFLHDRIAGTRLIVALPAARG